MAGVYLGLVGNHCFWRGTPHINRPGFMNPGSTLVVPTLRFGQVCFLCLLLCLLSAMSDFCSLQPEPPIVGSPCDLQVGHTTTSSQLNRSFGITSDKAEISRVEPPNLQGPPPIAPWSRSAAPYGSAAEALPGQRRAAVGGLPEWEKGSTNRKHGPCICVPCVCWLLCMHYGNAARDLDQLFWAAVAFQKAAMELCSSPKNPVSSHFITFPYSTYPKI